MSSSYERYSWIVAYENNLLSALLMIADELKNILDFQLIKHSNEVIKYKYL